MKRLSPYLSLLVPIAIGISFSSSAQRHKIDSLLNVLKTEKDDTNKVKTLNKIAGKLKYRDSYDTSLTYANKALALAEKLNFKRGIADAYSILGDDYEYKENHSISLEYNLKAADIYRELGNKKALASEYGGIHSNYWNLGDYPKSLDYGFKALAINQELGYKPGISSSLSGIGLIYDMEGNDTSALKYYTQSMAISQELGDQDGVAAMLCDIGNIYDDRRDYAKALNYDFRALEIKLKEDDKRSIARNYGNIGIIYDEMGNYTQALEFEFKALHIDQKVDYKKGTSSKMSEIGNIYTRLKNYKLAKLYIDSAIHVAQRIGVTEYVKNAYSDLAHLDKVSGDYKQGFADYKKYIGFRDSLRNNANTRKIVQEGMNFQFAQKQAVEKAEQDKKDAIASQELKKQVIIRNSFIAGFSLTLALAFFIFRGYRQKQTMNRTISDQKDDVEKKQKEIVASLRYAQQIQRTLLASDGLLQKYIPEYFIMYKPKDIVSGDFYWATTKNDKFYLAICDSTGHGVPGAFMSLLNISFLNEAITEKGITRPNEVFNHTRKRLIENVSQDGGQDGMDGILLCFEATPTPPQKWDRGNVNKINVAAAYNTPIVVRDSQILEITSDKLPVGASPKQDVPFTEKTFELKENDMLYAFTDGFFDQFGGNKGKKFMHRRFLEKLLAISPRPLAEQKSILEQTFEEWKGMLEQVDDVLVVGIRM